MDFGEVIEKSPVIWFLGTLVTGFLAGLGTYRVIVAIAHLKIVTLTEYNALQAIVQENEKDKTGEVDDRKLSDAESSILKELISESKGIEDAVAVYPFQTNLKKLGLPKLESSSSIGSLQEKGFVKLDKEMGYDRLEERESDYPVYRVTSKGFRYFVKHQR